ncbi:MAG: thiamine pyrophosphate-binding protein [Chloroflexota bacterium]
MAQQPAKQPEERYVVDKLRPTAEFFLQVKEDPRAREKVNLGNCVADILKEEGVEYVFFLTGGGTATFIMPLQRNKIKCVHVRHEQTAGMAMDAWGRLTGRPGFALPGAGTGLTNFGTGLCEAYSAGAPGVALQAESGPFDDDKYGGQGIARAENQFQGICKWVRKVNTPNTLLWQLKRAFRSAVTPPYGPVVVAYGNTSISSDTTKSVNRSVAFQAYQEGGWKPENLSFRVRPDPALVERTVKWLLEAEKPVIIAGHEAHQDQCQEEFRELAHLLGVPSSGRRIARGIISELDPICYGRRSRGPVFNAADRCIVLGLRIGSLEYFGNPPFFPHNIRYCQIHSHPDYTELNLPTDIEIIGNIKETLKMMIQCVKDMGIKGPVEKWEKWRQFVRDTEVSYQKRVMERADRVAHQMPVHPDLVGRYTAEVGAEDYNNDYISIIDGFTASAYYTAWNVCTNTASTLDASETIGIGHSPGMALAAGLATNRSKPIVGLMGDGAVGAAGMDIETCCRWNIPAIFIHENNNTLINGSWENWWSKVCAVEGNILHDSWETMPDIRYDQAFATMGAYPEFVEKPEELKPALKRSFAVAMKEKRPAFVEVFVDQEVIHSSMGSARALLRQASSLNWDEVPERGRKLAATVLVTPQLIPRLPKDWQEGITAYMKK